MAKAMTKQEIRDMDLSYNLHSWSVQGGLNPIVVDKSQGVYFWDADGKRYTDMCSQLVNLNIGHGNQKIAQAIAQQAQKMAYIAPSFAVEPRSRLAKAIVDAAPDNMGKVFFTNAGADANENAVKIARMYTGRNKIFSRYRSYHGSSFGAGNLTGEPRRYPLEPGIPGFIKFFDPYLYRAGIDFKSEREAADFYVAKLREQIQYEGPDSVAAVVLESVTGSNGVIIPPEGYMQGVRKACDEFGVLMICDEVMTGFYRTGTFFAVENWGVKPDIITFAKGITCGYVPLGGVIVSKDIAAYFDTHMLSCGLTYSAHPLACAAGLATLEAYEEAGVPQNVKEMGEVLAERLDAMEQEHPCVGQVRHIGLFAAVELVKDKQTREPLVPYGKDPEGRMKKICGALIQKGFYTYTHENMLLVAPPLIIRREELEPALDILDQVLADVDQGKL